ncbi:MULTISPECIES: HK97 gp10 family phage protein [unclassified Erwinia]|uniref:HK97 gp10 family phage protein n=1 Tax=unclassified Erwinia TaxID=2622719 RepID=UPI000C1A4972|nr:MULTISPECIES: HK97 gp10 family phage protein [unclassified Erwinia]PIJ49195.1 hypothetical protein BV501_13795 [Erwinia sp. OAMSP11]PIJ79898.1 hypothetical protein BLD47_12555 [Erwinia sp. OLCASP19]PIJ81066.1 hypothetical protein BLD46_13365 [Erwinia sp. OLMTSP26]PIJ93122.1 hypothetical protein BL249_05210 [Erwinia sp. OLFS4]
MADNAQFSLDIKAHCEAAKADMLTVTKKAMIDVANRVVDMSPVDTGRFRSNWEVGHDIVPDETTPEIGPYPRGPEVKARLKNHIEEISGDVRFIFLANTLPYAYRLEMEGWSKQAPAGMLRVVVPEFQTYLDKAARELKK